MKISHSEKYRGALLQKNATRSAPFLRFGVTLPAVSFGPPPPGPSVDGFTARERARAKKTKRSNQLSGARGKKK